MRTVPPTGRQISFILGWKEEHSGKKKTEEMKGLTEPTSEVPEPQTFMSKRFIISSLRTLPWNSWVA